MNIQNRVEERSFQMVRAGDLIPDERNWRVHSKGQTDALLHMLERVGWVSPVLARRTEAGLVIVDGHLRAGLAPDVKVPVVILDVDEVEAGELLASLDPIAEMASLNKKAFAALTAEMDAEMAGFIHSLVDGKHLKPVDRGDTGVAELNAMGREAPETSAALGDLFALGRHRVLVGDSTNADCAARLLDGAAVDALIADPPYAAGGFKDRERDQRSKGSRAVYRPLKHDTRSMTGIQALLRSTLNLFRPSAALALFTHWKLWPAFSDAVELEQFTVRNMLVWDKGYYGMGSGWRNQHELILVGCPDNADWPSRRSGPPDLLRASRSGNVNHPTEKPLELMVELLDNLPCGDAVCDPFLGSGSTLLAAEALDKACFGMELDPVHVDAVCQRWRDIGGKVELVGSAGG